MSNVQIGIKKLVSHAIIPTYQHKGDAGADVYSSISITICPGEWKLIPLGLAFDIPEGWEMQIRARSGLAYKYGLSVLNGVGTVDSGYKGEVKVILVNHGWNNYNVQVGERIAQIVFQPVYQGLFLEREEILPTDRGNDGFGSTGRF